MKSIHRGGLLMLILSGAALFCGAQSSSPSAHSFAQKPPAIAHRQVKGKNYPSLDGSASHRIEVETIYKDGVDAEGDEYAFDVDVTLRLWRIDPDSGARTLETSYAIERQKCDRKRGSCSIDENFERLEFWAPSLGVDDYFIIMRIHAGQLESAPTQTILMMRNKDGWRRREIKPVIWEVLDGADHGRMLLAGDTAYGCCGWISEGSSTLELRRGDQATKLYDQFERFPTSDYDVNIYAARAEFSPDNKRVVYQLSAKYGMDENDGHHVRLSVDGKENLAERAAAEKLLPSFPVVELQSLDEPGKVLWRMAQCEFDGWRDDDHIVVSRLLDRPAWSAPPPTEQHKLSGVVDLRTHQVAWAAEARIVTPAPADDAPHDWFHMQ